MADHDDESFQDMNLKEKIVTVASMTFLLLFVLVFVLGIYFFGFAGIFELLGVKYQSIWSLVLFVVSTFIVGTIVDLVFDAMAELSVANLTGKLTAFIIHMLFAFGANWIVLMTVDAFMTSIDLSLEAKLIIAFLLGVIEPVFDDKQAKEEALRN